MKDKWHNWSSSYYLITKRGKCVSCVQCEGETGESSYQDEWVSHTHKYIQGCNAQTPCWCFLVRCHYMIKRKPSGNRLSTTSCLLPRWQTSFCSCKVYCDFTWVNFLQKARVGGKNKEAGVLGLRCTLVGWYPVQALLLVQLGLRVTFNPPRHLTAINVCEGSLDGSFRAAWAAAHSRSAQLVAIQINPQINKLL